MMREILVLMMLSTAALYAAQSAESRMDVPVPPTTDAVSLAIAPDGDKIAFVAPFEGSNHLWVHSVSSGSARPLRAASNAGGSSPCWSPDSKSIAYFSQNRLMRVDVDGTSAQVVVEPATRGRGCAWNREGTLLFGLASARVILRVSDQGGTPTPAVPPDPQTTHSPHFLPDNRHFLYYATGGGVFVAELGGAAPKKLLDSETAAVYSRSGHILFVRNDTLHAQKFDTETLTLSGEPFVIDRPIATGAFRVAASTAPDGTLVYRLGGGAERDLKWLDRSGKEVETYKEPITISNSPPLLSPDGKFLLVDRSPNGNTDIFLLELATGKFTRLTESPTIEVFPTWSHDAKSIFFTSNQPGAFDLFERPLDLSADEKPVMPNRIARNVRAISADGKFLLYRGSTGDIWAIQLDGNPRGEFPVVETKGLDDWPQFSPDAKWIAYQSNESGRPEVYLQQFPSGRRIQVSTEGGGHPRWRRDGKELFYLSTSFRMMSIAIDPAASQNPIAGKPVELFAAPLSGNLNDDTATPQYNISPDGERFLFPVVRLVSTPLKVIRNWQPGR